MKIKKYIVTLEVKEGFLEKTSDIDYKLISIKEIKREAKKMKTHYLSFVGGINLPLCSSHIYKNGEFMSTINKNKITCKRCLKEIKKLNKMRKEV